MARRPKSSQYTRLGTLKWPSPSTMLFWLCPRRVGARLACILSVLIVAIVVLLLLALNWWQSFPPSRPVSPGPSVRATRGAVWPQPAHAVTSGTVFQLRPSEFRFEALGPICDVLQQGLERYGRLFKQAASFDQGAVVHSMISKDPRFAGNLVSLRVKVDRCETRPHPDMDEKYQLALTCDAPICHNHSATLDAPSVWGALRGLETFTQLLVATGDGSMLVNASDVWDSPRFPHRGLLLDTARHFLPVHDIKVEIDAMEAVKMNVLHWHIVDDQSFPWQSVSFPELSQRGAFSPRLVYTADDVANIIEYARLRGVRVIAEFDTPGHTRSWGMGRPGLLAQCSDGTFANIDPSKPKNVAFLMELFKEVADTFPDTFLHLGGDEVPDFCWSSDPGVRTYMAEQGYGQDYQRLAFDYLHWLIKNVSSQNKTTVLWQEAVLGADFPADEVVAQVWYSTWSTSATSFLRKLTRRGYRVLLSAGWYLDSLYDSWQHMYRVEPQDFEASKEQLDLVLGGEAAMWGEMVDETNVHSRVWPRAAAVAERLWSPRPTRDEDWAASRLEELACRLRRRGVPASPPNGPGFCL